MVASDSLGRSEPFAPDERPPPVFPAVPVAVCREPPLSLHLAARRQERQVEMRGVWSDHDCNDADGSHRSGRSRPRRVRTTREVGDPGAQRFSKRLRDAELPGGIGWRDANDCLSGQSSKQRIDRHAVISWGHLGRDGAKHVERILSQRVDYGRRVRRTIANERRGTTRRSEAEGQRCDRAGDCLHGPNLWKRAFDSDA